MVLKELDTLYRKLRDKEPVIFSILYFFNVSHIQNV